MSDYHETEAEIEKLEGIIQDALRRGASADWRPVWDQIKSVGARFKEARYPTKEAHQRAWDRFQNLIATVKEAQEAQKRLQQKGCARLNEEIDRLDAMLPGWLTGSTTTEWKSVWSQINKINTIFKEVRFPAREDREEAWKRFQKMVAKAKEAQQESHDAWDKKKHLSERHKDQILSRIRAAEPSSGIADVILSIATGGISMALNAVLGPFDEQKSELQRCSAALKEAGDLLHEYKDEMLGRDKHEVFQALQAARERLNAAWDTYKRNRESAYTHQHADRTRRVNERIENLEERTERLSAVLAKKEAHLNDLYEKLSDARSDDFRGVVSGWIREEESAIQEIREKLRNVETWLAEERDKLRR